MDKLEKLNIFKKRDFPKQVFQLKITLKDISPPIWRRVLISSYLTFADLHDVIQECFCWDEYHLHEFSYRYPEPPHWRISMKAIYPDESYPLEEDDLDFYDISEKELRLCDVFSDKLKYVSYLYDFGDNWDHSIKLEKVFKNENNFRSFLCVGGKRATPPEDCGGPYGYQKLIKKLANPKHPEYKERNDGIEDDFDPEEVKCPMTKMTPKQIELKFGAPLKKE